MSYPWAKLLPPSCKDYESYQTKLGAFSPRWNDAKARAVGTTVFLKGAQRLRDRQLDVSTREVLHDPSAFPPFRRAMEECGPRLWQYAVMHNAAMGLRSNPWLSALVAEVPVNSSATLRGLLVIRPEHGGMGNVLRIISQYTLLGVLLRRTVCIELEGRLYAQFHPFAHSPVLDWTCRGLDTAAISSHVIHVSKKNGSVAMLSQLFGATDTATQLSNFEVVRICADSTRMEPKLLRNPHLRAKQLVPQGRSASACVRQLFFQPTKRTLAELQAYLDELRFPRSYAAAHLRFGDSQMVGLTEALDVRVQPTHKDKLFRCVLARLGGASVHNSSYFIATDNAGTIPELLQRSSMRAVIVPGTSLHTGAWASAIQGRHHLSNEAGLQKVWLDHFLLSLGNSLLVSSGGRLSSFAEEAEARRTWRTGIVRCR